MMGLHARSAHAIARPPARRDPQTAEISRIRPGNFMPNVELTVLLATRNGEQVLPRTLDGYRRVSAPSVKWKIVVVDNGSTDSTPEIIRSFASDLPLQALVQPIAGKNRALNTGLAAVEGRLLVLTDDDTIPSPSFLEAWVKYLDFAPGYGMFGGAITPLFEVRPPKWLVDRRLNFALMFSERDLLEGPIEADDIYGPNMAVRTSVLQQGFRFDEELGPNALDPDYPMGGETDFCRRVASGRVKSWFASEPRVQHIVRPAQLAAAAWAKRAYRTGRGRAHQMWKRGDILAPPTPSWFDRLAMFSPLARHRLASLCVRRLAQGFRDECARRSEVPAVSSLSDAACGG
jgi:glucosyl-dolichyl phosphate glucuronosyltransferase